MAFRWVRYREAPSAVDRDNRGLAGEQGRCVFAVRARLTAPAAVGVTH